jgi:hypothetical protein
VTVGILALHYVTSDPIAKQLGMNGLSSRKGPQPIATLQSRTSPTLPSNASPRATMEAQACADDHDVPQDGITVPNRIFVRKTYDVQPMEPRLSSSNTPSIERKQVAEEVEEVGT